MAVFFTADTHFGHHNIIKLTNRPFASIDEMDKVLISNWNSVVTNDDVVYIVGDFMYKSTHQVDHYLRLLNGKKILIIGNHDKEYTFSKFDEVHQYLEVIVNGKLFVLFHYPILSWARRGKGSIHVYGHVHEARLTALDDRRAFNAGVELNLYTPVHVDTVIAKMEIKPILKSDGS